MIRTSRRVSALATTALLVTALPAHAARQVVKDPTGDVYTSDGALESFTPIGTRINADVKRTVLTHDRRALTAKSTYTDLVKNDDVIGFSLIVRTNEGLKRDVVLIALPPARKGLVQFTQHGKPTKELPCKGIRHQVDYARDTIRVSVPRSCLSNPRWVQVQVGAIAADPAFTKVDADDAQRPDVTRANTWGKKLKVG